MPSGIWYAVSALGGLLIGQTVGTVLALRLSGLGWSAFSRVSPSGTAPACWPAACGCSWSGSGCRSGSQTGRVLLAHLSTPARAVQLRIDGADLCHLLAGVVHRGAGLLAGLRQEAGSHRRDGSNVVATHGGFAAVAVVAALLLVLLGAVGGDGAVRRAN